MSSSTEPPPEIAGDGSTRVERALEPGASCWRIERAPRAAPLIDAATYFGALRRCLVEATRSVFIVGWDVDSRTRLVGADGETHDELPAELGELLVALAARRPELRIHVLLWDYSVLYALEREPLPALSLDWATPDQVKVCLDDVLPLGASHHQKLVIVDDAVAFCGGIDLTIRRWDTRAHEPGSKRRVDPDGEPYAPFHDVQMVVDGDAALALGELVRERWHEASCRRPLDARAGADRWPPGLEPLFRDVAVGISRTVPRFAGKPEVREVENLYLRSIEVATRHVYIENQFVTASRVAEALAKRLQQCPELEVVIVTPTAHHGWLEDQSMAQGRARFRAFLESRGVSDRVRLLCPRVPDGDASTPVMVHAKTMVVDDRLLRIGSSNLNNRSMGTDSECDLAIEASDDRQRAAVARYLDDLLAEHHGMDADELGRVRAQRRGLFATLDAVGDRERGLRAVEEPPLAPEVVHEVFGRIADPEKPSPVAQRIGDMFSARTAERVPGRGRTLLVGVAMVVLLIVLWNWSPLAELTSSDAIEAWFQRIGRSPWAPLVVPALYVAAGLTLFPVTVLIAVTAMVFSPGVALTYALGGSMLSALLSYRLGAVLGRRYLRDLMGRRLNKLSRAMASKGVLTVVAIRAVPVAPFTLINLAAGASHIRFRDYVLGTLLGMAPGIATMTFLGHQIYAALAQPTPSRIAMFVAAVAAWILVSLGFQTLVSRLRRGG